RLVDHLVLKREPARSLHDAAARVVDLWSDRIQDPGADAAIVVAAIRRPVGLDAVQLLPAGCLRLLTLLCSSLCGWSHCRNAPIRRIDNVGRHTADASRALEPMRRWRNGAADGSEPLLELLGAIQRELIAVVVGDVLVAL